MFKLNEGWFGIKCIYLPSPNNYLFSIIMIALYNAETCHYSSLVLTLNLNNNLFTKFPMRIALPNSE